MMRPSLREWLPPALLLAVFGGFCFWNLGAYEMLVWDEAEYACLGRAIAHGEPYAISGVTNKLRPPLLPVSIAASLLLSGHESDAAAKAPSVVFAMLALAIVYALVRRECGRWAALLAASSLAVAPEFVTRAVMLMSETPFLAFYTAALAVFYLGFQGRAAWFHAGWAAFALALSTRYTALLFGPTLALIALYEWRQGRLAPALRTRAFWLSPLWAAAILAPWFYRQWLVTGSALHGVRQASGQIPAYNVAEMPWHFYLSTLPDALTWPVALLGAAGLAWAVSNGRPLGIYAAISAFVLLAWHTQYDYKEARLVAAVWPLMAIGAGLGAEAWIGKRQGAGAWRRLAAPVALLCLGGIVSLSTVLSSFQARRALGEPSFLDAMRYLRENTAADARIVGAGYAQIHWYSQRPAKSFPKTLAEFERLGPAADWVVITNFERSQPDYVRTLVGSDLIQRQLAGDAAVFQDTVFVTALVKGELIERRRAAR